MRSGSVPSAAAPSSAARRTKQIKLGTLVISVTHRHPDILLETVTTLDVPSGGRAYLANRAANVGRRRAAVRRQAFPARPHAELAKYADACNLSGRLGPDAQATALAVAGR